ncbi:unnamed protein product [Amoebophrya sp. A25]|nr:unnamed protein product [Amoebophrya sp. A25]|eukprot:GSA25T00011025001.1
MNCPRHARHVGFAMRDCNTHDVPWWRCVNSAGGISLKGTALVERAAEAAADANVAASAGASAPDKMTRRLQPAHDKKTEAKNSDDQASAASLTSGKKRPNRDDQNEDTPSTGKAVAMKRRRKELVSPPSDGEEGEAEERRIAADRHLHSAALLQKQKLQAEGHEFSGKSIIDFKAVRFDFGKDAQ